jgi:hypothetical protein
MTAVRTSQNWRLLSEASNKLNVDATSAGALLARGEMVVSFAFAAGCLFAAVKLFRYSGAIVRLRQASRMHELERALRHQRTVWMVLGTVGAMWLLLFTSQLVYLFTVVNETEMERVETMSNPEE